MSERVLLVGGRGYFGRRLAARLERLPGVSLALPSRGELDLERPETLPPWLEGAKVAVCCAGPYQGLRPSLAEACLARGVHYLDLADDRAFVLAARALALARPGRAAFGTGFSAVPALSAVLASVAAEGLGAPRSLRIQLAPGNRSPRSAGTVASLLHSAGRSFTVPSGGAWREARGWTEPRAFSFPAPVGRRMGRLVDAPDHALFPELFGAREVEFRAGAELPGLDAALGVLAGLSRALSLDLAAAARPLSLALKPLGFLGTDAGALGVEASAEDGRWRRACLVAEHEAPDLAVLPAAVMTERLVADKGSPGLVPWASWLSRDGLERECARYGARLVVEEGRA